MGKTAGSPTPSQGRLSCADENLLWDAQPWLSSTHSCYSWGDAALLGVL